jgi:hypothetical protein
MATAPRPSAQQKRKALKITVHGIPYTLNFADLNPLDAADVRKATGLPLNALIDSDPDLDTIAVLYWLARRKAGDRRVTFAEISEELTYDAVLSGALTVDEITDEPEDTSDPEA